MKISHTILAFTLAVGAAACSQSSVEPTDKNNAEQNTGEQTVTDNNASAGEIIQIASGLSAKILKRGHGRAAEAGDYVEVDYTGWLYDDQAEDSRGDKFDSSVDRGEKFHFMLGAGQVISGWDQGVAGMLIGEKRELTIAPDMGYGDRGAGNVIPPGATLVFEVELYGLEGPSDSK
ncbi:MAG: FKBP-type peptidyl-prolyl cis-trans isomerase [Gammaproteobacteria bacterium]|nr:FKBP-type peptidyl-prolyl cis-trans isomerase [Gammaproteobacteria bacterium]MDH3432478.1 FKBP-type peptidyl-prolyl cis-trans isomerase [Gammaproteobacteria bacterium]